MQAADLSSSGGGDVTPVVDPHPAQPQTPLDDNDNAITQAKSAGSTVPYKVHATNGPLPTLARQTNVDEVEWTRITAVPLLSQQAPDEVLGKQVTVSLVLAFRWLWQNRHHADVNILYAMRSVQGAIPHSLAYKLVKHMLPYAAKNDPTFKKLYKLVDHPHLPASERVIPKLLGIPVPDPSKKTFNEPFSDKCIASVLECHVPKKCLNVMGGKNTLSGYSMTHKMLLFMLFVRHKCMETLTVNGTDISAQHMLQRQIMAMWEETLAYSKYSDLYTERLALGGLCGYTQFLHPHFIRTIFGHQSVEEGCWGQPTDDGYECDMHQTAVSIMPLALYLHFTDQAKLFNPQNWQLSDGDGDGDGDGDNAADR